jgi:hypothetical protein
MEMPTAGTASAHPVRLSVDPLPQRGLGPRLLGPTLGRLRGATQPQDGNRCRAEPETWRLRASQAQRSFADKEMR